MVQSFKLQNCSNLHPATVWCDPDNLDLTFLECLKQVQDILKLAPNSPVPMCSYSWQTKEYHLAMAMASFGVSDKEGCENGYLLGEDDIQAALAQAKAIAENQPIATLANGVHHMTSAYKNGKKLIGPMCTALKSNDQDHFNSLMQQVKDTGTM
ncbi:hypothetical protein FRC11_001473 [Ceratobasidium sp. 423]|nr:hypothetical protein FRC11_001473 [Ceratobasidium sp. 423]